MFIVMMSQGFFDWIHYLALYTARKQLNFLVHYIIIMNSHQIFHFNVLSLRCTRTLFVLLTLSLTQKLPVSRLYSVKLSETFINDIFFSLSSPPEFKILTEYSYFQSNVIICIGSIRIYSPCQWKEYLEHWLSPCLEWHILEWFDLVKCNQSL